MKKIMTMKSFKPVRVVIPTGFGINCEKETAHAFHLASGLPEQIHLNDLLDNPSKLAHVNILALAGGFSFGDHLGAGKVLANRLLRKLGIHLKHFIDDGGLVIGICNGFQTMARLGLIPKGELGQQTFSLALNQHGKFYDGWVNLRINPQSPCIFTKGLTTLEVPVRHGEGRVVAPQPILQFITKHHLAPVQYANQLGQSSDVFPQNPNGSVNSIAGLSDLSGRCFGLMPHPEAFLYPENHPQWKRRKLKGDGLQIFRNAVNFARNN
jgi:phosphoribosylformylglycinamidine (FGAM) synthase-like amidotransferase family enzyme